MKTLNVTEARKDLFNLVNNITKPVNIRGKKQNAVLISDEEYRGIKETLYLMSIPGLWESIEEARKTPISECLTEEEHREAVKKLLTPKG
jgi:antitoxin YefM